MIGSVLSIKIVEGREFKSSRISGIPNPYVQIRVDSQVQNTSTLPGTSDPFFNELLSFDIVTGREEIRVRAFDKADMGNDSLIGECALSLENLKD